jgi:hypothetical protein
MKKSEDFRKTLAELFGDKRNWNRLIEVDGERYIYVSALNEIRQLISQPSGTIAVLVGCFVQGYLMWC